MEDYTVNLVVFGVISWTTAFLLTRRFLPNRSLDFCNRLVSTIHASLAVTLSALSVQDWNCPVCPLASDSSPPQMKALAVSLAYLIYDLICGLFDKKIKMDNLIHHLVSIVGFTAGLAYKKAMALGLQLVSAFWFYKIARMVNYKLTKRTTST